MHVHIYADRGSSGISFRLSFIFLVLFCRRCLLSQAFKKQEAEAAKQQASAGKGGGSSDQNFALGSSPPAGAPASKHAPSTPTPQRANSASV